MSAMIRTVLKIDGMVCGMCEAHVNEAIRRAIPQAKKLSSSHKKAEASFLTEEAADLDALRAAIESTGYRVLSAESAPYEKKGLFGR